MYQHSQRGLSAALFTIVHDMGSGHGVGAPFKNKSTPWLALVKAELSEHDVFSIRDNSSFDIELAEADESRALKIARLIRNSFQLHMAPRTKVRLSTGIVMYQSDAANRTDLLKVAERLAVEHISDAGNKISFENYTLADLETRGTK